jgi:hypothetical protein
MKIMIAGIGLLLLTGCAGEPKTDAELSAQAHQAVDRQLGVQATFSEMEAIVGQQIACGHATAPASAAKPGVEQDFVYQSGRLIMDNDPDFDAAAVACDDAAGGGNVQSDENAAD